MSGYNKYQRSYILTLDGQNFFAPLVLTTPFTLEFDIQRDNYASTNRATLRIYNLSQAHRTLITRDQYDYSFLNDIIITFQAGYGLGPQYPIVFKGQASRAYSVREGTDFVTTIEAYDGGTAFQNATTERSWVRDTPMNQIYSDLISDLAPYGISKGAVSNIVGNLSKGMALNGNTVEILREISNSNFFIDNLNANVLLANDAIGGNQVTINAQSGLLGTPLKEQQLLIFDILFEPRLVIGSTVNIQSQTALSVYNGPHKVVAVHHKGTISSAVAGDAITTLTVESGIFSPVTAAVGL